MELDSDQHADEGARYMFLSRAARLNTGPFLQQQPNHGHTKVKYGIRSTGRKYEWLPSFTK